MRSLADERGRAKAIAAQVRILVAVYLCATRLAYDNVQLLDRIEQLSMLIALWGARMNLTSEAGDSRELAFHFIDSLSPAIFADRDESLQQAFRAGNQVLDLGSGAGFPGLLLAATFPANFTLTEARRKRASFLDVAAAEMDLKNVTVASQRLNSTAHNQMGFDVVTARAFATASAFHSVAASALKPGGLAILYANSRQDLALPDADKKGLYEFRTVAYTIPHRDRVADRILALWQRRQIG
jgi:16S rRNA (guanine527-N7)-methyltransferase